jgi:hypothetical protein
MKLAQARDFTRQSDDVSRSPDIDPHRNVFGDRQVINGSQMKDARGLLLNQLEIRGTHGECGLAYVALDDPEIVDTLPAELREPLDLFHCTRSQQRLHQQNEVAPFAREPFQQAIGDKTRKPGYEQRFSIRHRLP